MNEIRRTYFHDKDDVVKSINYGYRDIDGRDILHNEYGPALLIYYPNGKISVEGYYIHGKKHREDGPALLMLHNITEEIYDKHYFINDTKVHEYDILALQLQKILDEQLIDFKITYEKFLTSREDNFYLRSNTTDISRYLSFDELEEYITQFISNYP